MPVEIGDGVSELIQSQEIQEEYGVPERVARRLWDQFRTTDLDAVDRGRLQQVRGVGRARAEKINPPRSDAYRAREREAGENALIRLWHHPYDDDKLRVFDENPEWAREQIITAAAEAAAVLDRL